MCIRYRIIYATTTTKTLKYHKTAAPRAHTHITNTNKHLAPGRESLCGQTCGRVVHSLVLCGRSSCFPPPSSSLLPRPPRWTSRGRPTSPARRPVRGRLAGSSRRAYHGAGCRLEMWRERVRLCCCMGSQPVRSSTTTSARCLQRAAWTCSFR